MFSQAKVLARMAPVPMTVVSNQWRETLHDASMQQRRGVQLSSGSPSSGTNRSSIIALNSSSDRLGPGDKSTHALCRPFQLPVTNQIQACMVSMALKTIDSRTANFSMLSSNHLGTYTSAFLHTTTSAMNSTVLSSGGWACET